MRIKADASPVTEADVRAEEVIRAMLERAFPGYGFYGEETGQHAMGAESIWLVDPIDGTKSFVRESPFFSTQIALHARRGAGARRLERAGLRRARLGRAGGGAFLNERRIRVSSGCGTRGRVRFHRQSEEPAPAPQLGRLGELIGRVNRIRGYGDFVHYHLLARGSLDVVIESDVNILDIAALGVIVREAGGTFTDWRRRGGTRHDERAGDQRRAARSRCSTALTR